MKEVRSLRNMVSSLSMAINSNFLEETLHIRSKTELIFKKFKEWYNQVQQYEVVTDSKLELGTHTESFHEFAQCYETVENCCMLAVHISDDILVLSVILGIHKLFLHLMRTMSGFSATYKIRVRSYIEKMYLLSKQKKSNSKPLIIQGMVLSEILDYFQFYTTNTKTSPSIESLPTFLKSDSSGEGHNDYLKKMKNRMLSFKPPQSVAVPRDTAPMKNRLYNIKIEPIIPKDN